VPRLGSSLSLTALAASLAACGTPSAGGACAETFDMLVATSDYSSTQVGGVSLDGRAALSGGVDLGRDPALSLSRGRAFLVARDVDALFELDPRCGKGVGRTSTLDFGDGGAAVASDPYDVGVAADGALVVARFGAPSLMFVHGGATDRLDLSSLDDDGNPDMDAVRVIGAKAFVALGRLDGASKYRSTRPSAMAIVDVAARAVVRAVPLAARNPFGAMVEGADGALWMAAPGNFSASNELDAGLLRFDTKAETSELVAREGLLGGSPTEVAVDAASTCAAVIVADPTPNINRTRAVVVTVATHAVAELVGWTQGFDLRALAFVKDKLVVGDRRVVSGRGYALHVLRRDPAGPCRFVADGDLFVSGPPIAVRTL